MLLLLFRWNQRRLAGHAFSLLFLSSERMAHSFRALPSHGKTRGEHTTPATVSGSEARWQRQFQKRMRGKNVYAPKGIERKKVRITSDDVRCVSTYSEFEELVIPRIAASRYLYIHINPLSLARQSREKTSNLFLIDVSAKTLPAQNFVKFRERRKRKQDVPVSERQIKSLARFGIGKEQGTDEDVRIKDAAQLGALQKRIQYLRCESPSLCFTPGLIENLLQRRVFTAGEFAKPKAQQGLHLKLFLWAGGVVRPRCLRVQRDRN